MEKRLSDNLNNVQHDYLAPFLWLHWEEDELILNEIKRIYDCGIRSVCLESRTHEDFCHDGWWEDIELIFKECDRLGMKVWILDDKHFPSGHANGVYEDKKELHPWGITEEHMSVPGPVKDGCVTANHWTGPEDEIIGVVAVEQLPCSNKCNRLIDLTDNLKNDMVYFDLPEGLWRITFLIKTRRGITPRFLPICDKLSSEAIKYYIDEVYQPHYDRFKKYFGNTFLGFFSDEPGFKNNSLWSWRPVEFGLEYEHHPWNDSLLKKLEARNGADARKMLAALWFDIDGISEKIRFDFMDIITDEYRNNFTNPLADWCRDHGVMYIGHIIEDNNLHASTGQGPGHYFRSLDKQDMSGIDVVLNQIMPGLTECRNTGHVSYRHMNYNFFNYYLAKLGSSFAHIDAKKQGRAMCEIFGAYGWAEGTKIMKYLMDHMLVRGINYFVPHAFSPKPNDPDCPPNFYDTGRNPQYKYFGHSMNYLQRMCHILSGGTHISTCAILYDAENIWLAGNRVPLENIAKKLYDNLLDYDIIPEDYLNQFDDNNCINGEKYNVILVPYSDSMSVDFVNMLKTVKVPVVFVTDGVYKDTFGYDVVQLNDLVSYMNKSGYRDISSDYDGIYLRYFHTVRNEKHILMLSNEDIHNTVSAKINCPFHTGGSYIEYDAFHNKALKKYGDVIVDIPPYNNIVLIFDNCDEIDEYSPVVYNNINIIDTEWNISIARENSNDFKHYTTTNTLFNITGKDGIGDFSGHMKYDTTLDISSSGGFVIDFGYVGEAMELYVNDKFIGHKQYPPYEFDISDSITAGKNTITAIVSNHNGYSRRDFFSKYVLMEASGIIGPVVLKEKK